MIYVIATIEVAPGTRDEFLRHFHAIVPTVLAEDGCIEYGPAVEAHTSIARQAPPRENSVTIIEKWNSVNALETHLAASHMQEYREKVKDLVQSAELRIFEPA